MLQSLTKQQVKSQRKQLWEWCFSFSGVSLPYLPACCSPRCASPRATEQPAPSFSQNPWIPWPSPQSAEHKPCSQRSAGCISSSPAAQFGGCPQDLQDKGQAQLQQQKREVGEEERKSCSIELTPEINHFCNLKWLFIAINKTHSVQLCSELPWTPQSNKSEVVSTEEFHLSEYLKIWGENHTWFMKTGHYFYQRTSWNG